MRACVRARARAHARLFVALQRSLAALITGAHFGKSDIRSLSHARARTHAQTHSNGESIIMRPALSNCPLFSLRTLLHRGGKKENFPQTRDFFSQAVSVQHESPQLTLTLTVTLWALESHHARWYPHRPYYS